MRIAIKQLKQLINEALADVSELFQSEIDATFEELEEHYKRVLNVGISEAFERLTQNGTDWTTYKKRPRIMNEIRLASDQIYGNGNVLTRDFSSLSEFQQVIDDAIEPAVMGELEQFFENVEGSLSSKKKIVIGNLHKFVTSTKYFKDAVVKRLAFFLKDYEKTDVPAETAEDDPVWGKYAFATDRKDAPYEPNAPSEGDAEAELHAHFDGSNYLSANTAQKILNFTSSNQYTKLLEFPADEFQFIYRGMSVTEQYILNLLGNSPDAEKINSLSVGEEETIAFNGSAVPRGDSASWTVSKKIAEKFSTREFEGHEDDAELFADGDKVFALVITAKTSENDDKLLLNPDTIYNVRDFMHFKHEKEVIGVGPIKFFSIKIKRLQ
jgi:hypothetical protein